MAPVRPHHGGPAAQAGRPARPLPRRRARLDAIRKAYTFLVFLDRDRQAAIDRAGSRLENAEHPVFAGDPAALRDYLAERIELGFDHFQLVFPGFPETDDIELFVDEVLPAFR